MSALVVFLLDAASWGMQGGLSEDSLLGLIVRVALGVNFGLFWGRVRLRRYYRRWYRDHPLGDSELLMFVFSRWAEENRRSAPWN